MKMEYWSSKQEGGKKSEEEKKSNISIGLADKMRLPIFTLDVCEKWTKRPGMLDGRIWSRNIEGLYLTFVTFFFFSVKMFPFSFCIHCFVCSFVAVFHWNEKLFDIGHPIWRLHSRSKHLQISWFDFIWFKSLFTCEIKDYLYAETVATCRMFEVFSACCKQT